MRRSVSTPAIVIKRVSTGENDRVITLLTQTEGKIAVIAKGVRRLASSQRAFLEPGNQVQAFLVHAHGMPILTQSQLIQDAAVIRTSLLRTKQLWQILEIVDRLTPEGEEDPSLYEQVHTILDAFINKAASFRQLQTLLDELIQYCGYPGLEDTPYTTLTEYVQTLADKPLKSYDYMTVKSTSRGMGS